MYKKQWKEPSTTWWFNMKLSIRSWWNKQWRSVLVAANIVLCTVIPVSFAVVDHQTREAEEVARKAEIKATADETNNTRWDQLKTEAKMCEPLFFVKKELAAHKLWKLTCIDENGKASIKYFKGNHFQWHWKN